MRLSAAAMWTYALFQRWIHPWSVSYAHLLTPTHFVLRSVIYNCLCHGVGALEFVYQRVQDQGHAVIVVAEGFDERIFGKGSEKDAGGNRKMTAVGVSGVFGALCVA
jgi:hypothetical protein